jgi:hypothetical protein
MLKLTANQRSRWRTLATVTHMARDNQRERARVSNDESDDRPQKKTKRRGVAPLVSNEERRLMLLLRHDIERQAARTADADEQLMFVAQLGSIDRELAADDEGRARGRRNVERRPRRED